MGILAVSPLGPPQVGRGGLRSLGGQDVMTLGALERVRDHEASAEPTAALSWLPVASPLLADDGSAPDANDVWVAYPVPQSRTRWEKARLPPVEALDRVTLRARLRGAAAAGRAGSADIRLAHTVGGRSSRWWWRPGPARRIAACAANLNCDEPDGDKPEGSAADLSARAAAQRCHPRTVASDTATR
jgi:hypothetical protein